MSKKKDPQLEFDLSIVGLLACPACHGDLRLDAPSLAPPSLDAPNPDALNFVTPSPRGSSRLICAACDRAYPIVDGIPVLITERAVESHP